MSNANSLSPEKPMKLVATPEFWIHMHRRAPHTTRQLLAAQVDEFDMNVGPNRFAVLLPMPREGLPPEALAEIDQQTASARLAIVFEGTPEIFRVPPAGQPLDGKFRGTIYRHLDQKVVSPDEWVVFLAKDNAFPDTLRFYRAKCEEIGAAAEQLAAVDRLIARVDAWRAQHPEAHKIPDAVPGECH